MINLSEERNLSYGDDKRTEAAARNNPELNFVTCLYIAKVADICRYVTATWSKNLANHSLCIEVENPSDKDPYTCKIDLKTWQFWGKKGLKSFKVDEQRVDVFWDFRSAKFYCSPEPCSNYYVALVSNGKMVLVLGDQQDEAFKRSKARPSSVEARLLHKKENVFGKKSFCARTMLGNRGKEHYIVIETSLFDPFDPEMWIGIDGIELLRVNNLHWRFRGNENIVVDDVPVQVFWDVHDWLYNAFDSGPGMFIFIRSMQDKKEADNLENGEISEVSFYSPLELPFSMDFCHFVYAWIAES